MFRHRVRPPTPPLDEATAERLLGGAPLDDLPDAFRPLGQLLAAASGPPTDDELAGSAAAAAAFVAAHDAARPRPRRRMSLAASAFTALALAASTGTAFAASQGALPEPMQQVAHETLKVVGISVPDINDRDAGDRRNEPAVATVGGATNDSTTPPLVTTPSHGTAGVNSTLPAAPGVTTEPASGNDSHGNSSAGEGNAGQGDPQGGDGNGGNSGGNGGNGNGGDGAAEAPASNLPSPSHGNGNGPSEVPPGQAKKTP